MTTENYYVLAFDIDDTKKIVKKLKDKKKKILALTPNAFEILKSNKFENIITPHEISKNLHQNLAEENIRFRDQLNYILKKNKNVIFSDESFQNIIIQCFSTLNFFSITLKKNSFYYLFLDNKFELNSNNQTYHKLIDLIIVKKYGIFKINKNQFR